MKLPRQATEVLTLVSDSTWVLCSCRWKCSEWYSTTSTIWTWNTTTRA